MTSLESLFDQYLKDQEDLFERLEDEQAQAVRTGVITDPKSEQHGGYRVACIWPDQVTHPACMLSARLAELLPGTPAYGYESIHVGYYTVVPSGFRVDPMRPSN